MQNEICRMRLNVTILDELVHEYCVYRGIVDPAVPSAGGMLNAYYISRSLNSSNQNIICYGH